MAVLMPFGKTYGRVYAFLFGSLSIVLFDLVTSGLGIWTLITALTYGFLGIGAQYFFRNRSGWKNYALYSFVAIIVYDAITGLTIGPLVYGTPFIVALVGQIPFTALHLLGGVSFAIVLSPSIERWVTVKNTRSILSMEKKVLVS